VGLADAIAEKRASSQNARPSQCPITLSVSRLPQEDADALTGMVMDFRMTATAVAGWLNAEGAQVVAELRDAPGADRDALDYVGEIFARTSADAVRRHRRGACSCSRDGNA
jgi:hypothetical protein